MNGKLHSYAPGHVLFEYQPNSNATHTTITTTTTSPKNILLFIGGLGDTFLTVPYVESLAVALLPRCCVCHVQLSSAGSGWGMASLDQDCDEIALAVKWVRGNFGSRADGSSSGSSDSSVGEGGAAAAAAAAANDNDDEQVQVVLIGHSTGCQDVLHYLSSYPPDTSSSSSRPAVQGAILQAPVSDRESLLDEISRNAEKKAIYDLAVNFAASLDEDEQNDMILPLPWSAALFPYFARTPICVRRFLSLASPESPARPREDDLFSSDASRARLRETWGAVGRRAILVPGRGSKVGKPSLMVAMMEKDEYVPDHVEMEVLLMRWKGAVEEGGVVWDEANAIVNGGKHNLRGRDGERKEARDKFVQMVKQYLGRIVPDDHDDGQKKAESKELPHRPSL